MYAARGTNMVQAKHPLNKAIVWGLSISARINVMTYSSRRTATHIKADTRFIFFISAFLLMIKPL